MQDLLLWQHLNDPELPPAETLEPLLWDLSYMPEISRVPFYGLLHRVLTHPDAGVRRAAVCNLAGAGGIPAWSLLVAALKDREVAVRQAAVEALHVSASTDPGRWIHARFHPDPLVRQYALRLGAPYGFYYTDPEADPGASFPSLTRPAPLPVPGTTASPAEHLNVKRVLEAAPTPPGINVLETFLRRGTGEDPALRQQVAQYLCRNGRHDLGLPILLQQGPLAPGIVDDLAGISAEQLEVLARGAFLSGLPDYEQLMEDILYRRGPTAADERTLAILLTDATSLATRQFARDCLPASVNRDIKLMRLARAFAWGVEIGFFLTGQRFHIEPIVNEQDLGYTRLRENRVYISARPILLGERGGVEVVRGLILHEFGHHLYHKGAEADAVWQQADNEGLGRLLNLVSDEHLERNLRHRNSRYGDLLKLLNAYAFQYSNRQILVETLLWQMGSRAATILPQVPLGVARKAGHVLVSSGRLLRELEERGNSFARFIRALRMGLGNRTGDPRVAAGLALFKGPFRKSTMPELLEIARRLRAIFGSEADMLNYLDQDGAFAGDEDDWLYGGEGLRREDVQKEVDSLMQAKAESSSQGGKRPRPGVLGWGLNLRPDEVFNPITHVEKLPHDPAQHAEYARRVARPARLLRRYFQDLGLGLKPQRFRLQGRRFDRARVQDMILKADPRVLIARQMERYTDLFLGVAIDCSGSMAGDKLEKAKLFGTLLAEGLRGLRGVDLRLFGFTHAVIWDVGTAGRCAVHALYADGGNNDAAALWHVARVARASRRRGRLLVMISDGLPTECSVAALRSLVARLTRQNYCCAQVAVQPLSEICFPHYVLLKEQELDACVHQFGIVVMGLVRRALGIR